MELEDQYRSKVRRAAGVMLGWCAALLAAERALGKTPGKGGMVAALAVAAGGVALVLARRMMRVPCPACGANLHGPVRAAVRRGSRLTECPECGHVFN